MKKFRQRIVSAVLAFSILLPILPLTVFAQERTLYGDVNKSGVVDRNDVDDLKKYLAEYDIDIDEEAADVNLDGSIDLRDLLLIEKYVAGMNVALGDNVIITFDTDGGTPVDRILLCNGAALTDVTEEPLTTKDGYIFVGWFKEDSSPFYAEEPLSESLTLYAKFEEIDTNVEETPISFALEDQSPDLSYQIVTKEDMTAGEVLAGIALTPTDGSAPVDIKAEMVDSRLFTVSAANGFTPGCSYELTLSNGLYFKDKAETLRKATFVIHKDEVDNLQYKDGVKYIRDTDEMFYTIEGSGEVLPMLDVSLFSSSKTDTVMGYFEYRAGGLAAGDTLCIYEGTDPRERDYTKDDYQDERVAFVKVVGVIESTVYFKGLEDKQAGDVLFIPDTIPFSVFALPAGETGSIDGTAYDTDAWSFMGRIDAPAFDVGDFLVFYAGAFKDLTDTSPVYYAEVTGISGTTIFFKQTTAEAIQSVNDLFLSNPMSGDQLLENVDTGLLENQIENQALDSGFAEDAANYLVKMAAKTDNFRNMTLENVTFRDENGNRLTKAQVSAIAEKASKPEVSVKAKVSKDCINFKEGVRLELTINAEFSVKVEEGYLKFSLVAVFAEEISVKVSVNSHAHVTWYLIVPVLDELTFGASTDIKNYSSIAVDLRIYTVEDEEDAALWDKFQSFKEKYKETLNKIKEYERMIEDALELEKIREYREKIQSLWLSMPEGSQETYEEYSEELGEINMSSMLNRLLESTSEEETEAGVQDLMNRYSKLMKNETAWVTLVEKQIFEVGYKFIGGLVSVDFELKFVIKANVNISVGFSMDYLVGKRYSFWIDVFDKTSGSSVTDITDEKFAFKFYVMGYLGLKMGIQAEVSIGVLWGLASVGITGEFGPYVKLWGYFTYQYTKMRPANTTKWNVDTKMAGALYLEFGIYVTISFNVNVVKKTVYNPDLYDKEFPLLTAGVRNNVYAFGYKIDKDETVLVEDEDNDSNNGITMKLPESFRLMQYMDLVEGDIEKDIYDYSNFSVALSNNNFSFDVNTGIISVNVPQDVRYMKCNLTLTWKQGKLAFSSKDLRIVIPLVWTSLSDSELKQKFTVTVYAGNESDGYTPVWSERVMKNEYFSLPTYLEMLEILNYKAYVYNGRSLKYKEVLGYGSQPTTDLTTYMDANYYFNVTLQEFELTVDGVQNTDGTTRTETFKAKFGDKFNLDSLKNSGTDDAVSGVFTTYYKTVAKDRDGNEITSDLSRPIDISFAKELASGTTYEATYVDNTVTVTYKFEGDINDIEDITIKIKRGTTPPDLFTQAVTSRKAIVKSVTPKIGNVSSNTTYTIVSKLKPIVLRTITYVKNNGTPDESVQIPEESAIARPNDPERSGYTFKGWYSDPEFKNLFVFDIMPSYDITLYAKWEGDEHKITFEPNGGVMPSGSESVITVKNGNVFGALPKPTFPQYKFLGWFTARTGGTQIKAGDTILFLEDTTVYARWQEKATIDPANIVLNSQSTTYNQYHQPVTFSVSKGPDKKSFTVEYMRQGLDSEWASKAVNAGTYNVKLSRPEDEDYKAFEKMYSGIYIINKAQSYIYSQPTIAGAYYGSIIPGEMTFGKDYVGEKLMFAAATTNYMPPTMGWTEGIAYNIYDYRPNGSSFYLYAMVAESENYYASAGMAVSKNTVSISSPPKALVSQKLDDSKYYYYYRLTVKTSEIKNAGTNSTISVKIGDGPYTHLDYDGYDDFEYGCEDDYYLKIDSSLFYNNCGGTIPVTLKYERSGSSPGWHCAWIRLDIIKYDGILSLEEVISGQTYNINHWFGAEDYDYKLIEETYYLSNYERYITYGGTFTTEVSTLNLQPASEDYTWEWTNPLITDTKRGATYNPYAFINAPALLVSFNDNKYNKYIRQGVKSFTIKSKELYAAMLEYGDESLELTYTLNFNDLRGYPSVSAETKTRTRTMKITRGALLTGSTVETASLKMMSSRFGKSFASILSSVKPGANGSFDVSYSLSGASSVWGTKFAVLYDTDKVELTGYTLGSVYTADEVTAPQNYKNGRYVFLGTRNDLTDTSASGKLVTLHFKIKDGKELEDYPIWIDTSQSIDSEGSLLTTPVSMNAPKINVIGNTNTILSEDKVTVFTSAGNASVQSVKVKKDDGNFVDITDTYSEGYMVTANGTYTFELITTNGETAATSITYTLIDNVKPVVAVNAGSYTSGTWTAGSITLVPYNTADNLGKTTFSFRIGEDGEWKVCADGVTVNADEVNADYCFKAVSESGLESDVVRFTVKLDNKAPEGEISIGQSKFRTLLNNITFGLFFKNTITVSIEAADTGSGVAKTEYCLSDVKADIESIQEWTEYTEPLQLEPGRKYVAYARITDAVGNKTIINSNGVVLFTDSTTESDSVEFAHFSTTDLTVAVNLNGNTIKEILIDGEVLDKANYSVDNGVVTLKADYLNTLSIGGHTLTILYYPLGETTEPQQGSETPAATTIELVITYIPVKGTDYTVTSNDWSNTDFVVTAKPGYELSLTNTPDGEWTDSITRSDETADGCLSFYVRNKTTGAISAAVTESYKIDKTAPVSDILIGTDSIKNALNAITFGLFFKDTRSITITADDSDSGVATVSYKLSDTVLDENALRAITDWNEYTEPFTIEPGKKAVVYVKVTDNAGNTLYIGSDGLVVENTVPVISGIENNKVYCSAVMVTVTDDNLDTVTVNGKAVSLTDGRLTLNPAEGKQTVVATDKAGNSTTVEVTVYDGHAWDEGIITEQPTSGKKGVRTYTCAHCGETKTEEIPMLAPSVIEGQNASYDPSKGGTLTFKSDAAFSDFIAVLVDGIEIDAQNYDVREGSIVITLKAEYLATLSAGKHTIGIKSVSGIASADFTVAEKTQQPQPTTGDNGNMHLWIMLFVSGSTITAIGIKRKKRKAVKTQI